MDETISSLSAQDPDLAVIQQEEQVLLSETPEAKTIRDLVLELDREEEFVRHTQSKLWRKYKHYWNGFQYLAWDEVNNDWRTPQQIVEEDPNSDIDPTVFAKVVNIYKAHGEIFIGALSAGTPTVRFTPRDADDPSDVTAAKARTKIAELIQRHNKTKLLMMKALYILYNMGMLACYNENKADYRFGYIEVDDFEDINTTKRQLFCSSCYTDLGTEYDPQMEPQMSTCPSCGQTMIPEYMDTPESMKVKTGIHKEPKTRECLEMFGPDNVKVPFWTKSQSNIPYLILESEEPVDLVREIYPEYSDKIQPAAYPDTYERENRVPSIYREDFPRSLCTVQRVWLRPWALNRNTDTQALKPQYEEGLYCVIINKSLLVEMLPDKLDDHWTLIENPLAEIIHDEPQGKSLIPIQEMKNELINITLETVEFGIGEVFADHNVIDFDEYKKKEIKAGQITPAKAPAGRSLGEGFYELKAANLSKEVGVFNQTLTDDAQFVKGTYPSIYGGALQEAGGTAREYEMSKASALQRLSIVWAILQEWWAVVIRKSVDSFVKNMQEDEKFVQGRGSQFVNVWIRKAELGGEIGEVEPEVSEAFPISWSQKRDIIMGLLQMGNEDIMTVFRHPENASLVASVIGVPELYIPGDDDRNKQLYEIGRLIREEPLGINPDGTIVPSVNIDYTLDNHAIEAEICGAWLKSEVGLDAKENMPIAYANVLGHFNLHAQAAAEQAQAQAEAEMGSEGVAGEQDDQ